MWLLMVCLLQGPEAVLELQQSGGVRQQRLQGLMALFGCGAEAAGGGASLRHGLSRLGAQCSGVFGCVQASLAPRIQPLLSLRLFALPSPRAAPPRLAVILPQVPHSSIQPFCWQPLCGLPAARIAACTLADTGAAQRWPF